ncbi:hypothetical protein F4Y93_06490 [Candidatus Poribacteria bacterium]|nr:hypothetical protein [Candidatus Poribacteria bacterium]
MRQKSMMLAIKALLCVGTIALCFIVYTLVSPVAMTEQQTPTLLKNQSKESTQPSVKATSKKKPCGCCEERMERLRKVIKQQAVSSEPVAQETEDQEVGKKPQ